MIRNRSICSSGFSLIEVAVALVVLAFAILAGVKMQTYLERESEHTQMAMAALQLAENEMQYAQTIAFDLLDGANGSVSRAGKSYKWVRTSTLVMSGDAKQITLSISWQDRWAQSHSLSLSTLRSKFN